MKTQREMETSVVPVWLAALHFTDNLSALGDLENTGGITGTVECSGEERILILNNLDCPEIFLRRTTGIIQ